MDKKYWIPTIGFFIAYYEIENGEIDEIQFSGEYAFYQIFCVCLTAYSLILLIN